ncbi:MAG TPA: glycoside hydrolase family 95 protein, partial [Verrucomicrobiae bacterium]
AEQEHLQLNEDTLYAGGPYDPANPEALSALPEVRRLIFAGDYKAAQTLAGEKMMAKPLREMPYETVGDLFLAFADTNSPLNYRRELALGTAIVRVSYTNGGVAYAREIFSSAADQVIVMKLSADQPGHISFTATMKTPQDASVQTGQDGLLLLTGINGAARGVAGALKFQARVRIRAEGGATTSGPGSISVQGADSAVILIAAATSYKNYHDVTGNPEAVTARVIRAASKLTFESLRQRHVDDYRRLFDRVTLDLGMTDAASLPTDERIRNFPATNDPALAALYFQFGRYLLISSSRPGGQPANLQGLWNDSMTPPWDSKYTININTEMNYWPADSCNLGECVDPLTSMVLDLTHTGARTAKVMWGAGGWVAHHNTDLWRATGPVDGPFSGMWPMGGAWLCQNLWEHYQFTADKNYLAEIYPAMKGAAQFFLDTLVPEPTHGWLVTCPSLSPENAHPGEGRASICAGPTMDMEILRDLFTNCICASEILNRDSDFRERVAAARAHLAPFQIGKAGQLQEWLADWDMEAHEIHHRHVSHLYGLFPSDQIDWQTTPTLADAARKSLEIRGDQATGWATAWRMNLWARLHDGDHVYKILQFLLSPQRTYPDMFDAHPPFQIDGNFGGTSAIAEMLLQSQGGELELLPALPKAWPSGSVRGLCARGGFEVSIDWADGHLLGAKVRNVSGKTAVCKIRYGGKSTENSFKPGAVVRFGPGLESH